MRGRSLRCPWRGIDFWTARIGNRVTRFSLHSFPNPTSHADACVLILVGLQGKHIVVRACKNPFCRRGMRKGGAAWQRSGPAARTLDLQDALACDAELFFATDAAALCWPEHPTRIREEMRWPSSLAVLPLKWSPSRQSAFAALVATASTCTVALFR
jgi:hypothetical protein